MQVLTIHQLTKQYHEKTVFDHFSYTAPPSGIVWISGPSGSGKTTLLRLIAGLERPDSGTIRLPERAKLSMVFQEDRLLPTLDARGNVLAALPDSGAGSRALADRFLERCGLRSEADRPLPELSGGMRRRVAIARALACGGNILLLDEPFQGLDAALKRQIMDVVFEDRSRLILLATHDPEEAVPADARLTLKKV